MNKPTWLLDFRADVFSQAGEDGVIGKVLDLLPTDAPWCVEFGASDGVNGSNSRHLIVNRGYSAVLVEPNEPKFAKLSALYDGISQVTTINAAVGFSGRDSLDRLLADHPIPHDFSFMSVDIDGNDYHVWKALARYSPRVVCIEFNPTIPTEVRFVQSADPAAAQGASLLALVELGKEKGYELVSVLPFNAIFVRREYFHLFGIHDNAPSTLRTDHADITYLFSGL